MSAHSHSSRVIPLCRGCDAQREADFVVAHKNGDCEPYCFPCGNSVMYTSDGLGYTNDGIGYPIEEYYNQTDRRVSVMDPHDEPIYAMFDPDMPTAWMEADNGHCPGSSVHVDDNR